MTYNIVDIESIIEKEIDTNNYVETLINLLQKYNVITLEEYEQIILKFITLLSTSIKKYTGKLSNSVKIEIAKNINESNMWTIGLYLKQKSIKESINILLNDDIDSIYINGKKELDLLLNKTKFFYYFIKKDFINNDNYFYNATLKDGIKGFFKIYNESYDARNICITVDYNPFVERPKLFGIEFIKQYLEYINFENLFCKNFKVENIKRMLKQIYFNYEELPINIFEIILTIVVILNLQNQNIYELNVKDIDIEWLYYSFKNDKNFINNLEYSYIEIRNQISKNYKMSDYLDRSFNIIKNNIIYSAENNTLEILFGNKKQTNLLLFK